jgi:REP element-mobilizing transposase RayT
MPVIETDPEWVLRERALLKRDPLTFDHAQRLATSEAMAEVCQFRQWGLYALNVRTQHAHNVVAADCDPRQVMVTLKAYSTRRLRERKLLPADFRLWSRGASIRALYDEKSLECACAYVLEGQGAEMGTGFTRIGI